MLFKVSRVLLGWSQVVKIFDQQGDTDDGW